MNMSSGVTVSDKVYGSNPEFPYNPQSFSISGVTNYNTNYEIENMLQKRLKKAREKRILAEKIIDEAPLRIQRIIQLKFMKKYSWSEVAENMNARSGESVRAEFKRWIKKN